MLSEKEKLQALTRLGMDLNQIQDLDILMERILTEARRFVGADAGSIYFQEDNMLHFKYIQNDTLQKRLPMGKKLIYEAFKIPINDKSIAGYVALTGSPLNIPDVYRIDPACSYGFNDTFDKASKYQTRSMLTVPLKNMGGEVIGVLQILNAQMEKSGEIIAFSEDDEVMMSLFASIAAVALERAKMTRSILLRMIRMAEMRDPKETGAHVNRVGGYAVEIYEKWAIRHEVPRDEIDRNRDILKMAAMLHDVGKVGISDLILKKPARFNHDEYEIMKQHTIIGARLFQERQSEYDTAAEEVAMNHHERWDGTGYPGHIDIDTGKPLPGFQTNNGLPRGKRGEEIPLFGRIVSLADVYDALISRRVYKEPWSEELVLETIQEEAGAQFDPELVDIFFSCIDEIKDIQQRYQDVNSDSEKA